jgi:uncharacterized membrane protein YdbT with pleckstrin-like domain
VSYSVDRYDTSMVVLESDAFRLRFRRELGMVDAQIAALSQPEEWWNLTFICEAVFGEKPEPSLEGYGPLIRRNLAGLTEALGPKLPETREAIARQAAERQKWANNYAAQNRPLETLIGRFLFNPVSWLIIAVLLSIVLFAMRRF